MPFTGTRALIGTLSGWVGSVANVCKRHTRSSSASPRPIIPPIKRNFSNFFSAADENADSRVMAGIHFRFSCKAGQAMGNKIGKWITENTLRKAE